MFQTNYKNSQRTNNNGLFKSNIKKERKKSKCEVNKIRI